jgi:hypothetical protein
MYRCGKFTNFADHPRQNVPISSGPNFGKTSSAAGRYQFIAPTWDGEKAKLKLPDFSPESQDAAAWDLAASTYHQKTGHVLADDLAKGDDDTVRRIEASYRRYGPACPAASSWAPTVIKFVAAYRCNLGRGLNIPAGRRHSGHASRWRPQSASAHAGLFRSLDVRQSTRCSEDLMQKAFEEADPKIKLGLRKMALRSRGSNIQLKI